MSNSKVLPKFRFSLRGLLITMTAIAVLLGVIVFPIGQMLVGAVMTLLLRGVLPTAAVAAAFYGRGRLQAFAIGAAVSFLPAVLSGFGQLTLITLVPVMISQLIAAAICGGVAVATRSWILESSASRSD